MKGRNVEASRCDTAGCGLSGGAQYLNTGGALCRLPDGEAVAARNERGRERPPSWARRLTHSPDLGGRSRPGFRYRAFRTKWAHHSRAAWSFHAHCNEPHLPKPRSRRAPNGTIARPQPRRHIRFRMEESWR